MAPLELARAIAHRFPDGIGIEIVGYPEHRTYSHRVIAGGEEVYIGMADDCATFLLQVAAATTDADRERLA